MFTFLSNAIDWIVYNRVIIFLILALFGIIALIKFLFSTGSELIAYWWDTLTQRKARYMSFGCGVDCEDYLYFSRKIHRESKKAIRKLPKEYIVKENICLKENDKYIFFDYVILSPYGIFPIAIHNAMGVLTGESSWQRLKHTTDGKAIFAIENPLNELKENTELLANKITVYNTPTYIHSYIGFSDSCRLAMTYRDNFINFHELPNTIRAFTATRLSSSQICAVSDIIDENNIKDYQTVRKTKLSSTFKF